MRQQVFEALHQEHWSLLGQWLEGKASISAEELPPAYRQLCHHLAVARERGYSPALVDQLQQLAMGLHHRFYGVQSEGIGNAFRFLWSGMPRQVRREWRLVAVASLLFLGTWLATFLLVRSQPDLVHLILSPDQASNVVHMYSPSSWKGHTLGASRDVSMFGYYIYNNIGIDFQVFASGLLLGVGPLFILPMNGLHGGAVMAHLANQGITSTFYGFISGHSSFELIGAILSGAGGLRMGLSLIHPGRRSRLEALKEGARQGSRLLFGAMVLTFLAACIEGFWSANTLVPWKAKVALGLLFWALILLWLALAGRRKP